MNGPAVGGGHDDWIGIEDAAAYLAIPVRTLYRLAQRGQVPASKVGRTWRFKRTILDDHLAATAGRPPDARSEEGSGGPPDHAPLGELSELADLSAELAGLLDVEAITGLVTERLRDVMDADVVAIFEPAMRDGRRVLVPLATAGTVSLAPDYIIPADGAPRLDRVLVDRRPVVIDDLPGDAIVGDVVVPTHGARSILLVPLVAEAEGIGMLAIASLRPRHFSALEIDRVMAIGGQTGTALTNARLLATSRRWSEHLEGIEALSRQLNRSRDVRGVGETVADKIGDIIDYDGLRFYVLQPDGETLEAIALKSRVEYYANETPELVVLKLGEGLGGTIALARQAEIVADVLADPRMQDIEGSDDIDESMIVVPMVFEERVLGVIELSRLGCHAFEPEDLRLMQILGAQAAVALENAARLEELERRSQLLEHQLEGERLLLGVTERLLQTRELDATFEAIAETLETVLPYDTLTIYRVDEAAGLLVPVLARDQFADEIMRARLPLGAGITGAVVQSGEAECVNDASDDPRVVNVPGTPDDDDESIIVAPLHGPNGVMGALNLYRIGRQFEPGELDLAKLYANHAAIALDNAILYQQLREAARHDPLTGLLHHGVFQEALADEVEAGKVAVLMIDLDDFRSYNNQFGHQAGDRLLRRIADGLRRSVRTGDLVCRYGGDEFALILPGTDEIGAKAVARKVLRRFAQLRSGDSGVRVGASIGTAAYPHDATDARDLVTIADTALFVAKHIGKGRAVSAGDLPTHVRDLRVRLDEVVRTAAAAHADSPGSPVDVLALVQPLHELLRPQDPVAASEREIVADLCRRFGPAYGLGREATEAVAAAALIVDIGRLAAMSGAEASGGAMTASHPVIGASLLEPYRELDAVTDVVRHHHERWDGGGYPDGLREESLSPGARLYAVVDRYHALVAGRGGPALSVDDATSQLRRESGAALAPDAVESVLGDLRREAAA
ncbi:MAG: GAF domain-containing protein [Candidatus Limnocylindrales bacterium]